MLSRGQIIKFNAAMDPLDYWRLCDELSVVQAAFLIVGHDPSESQEYPHSREPRKRPEGYAAAEAALMNAIKGKQLTANIVEALDDHGNTFEPDWDQTTIPVEYLRAWLKTRGFTTGFFFPDPQDAPGYVSQFHDHYSSKLAAAIRAWEAVSGDAELRRNKSVKQALVIWLRQHANEFGLTKEDGNPNEQGIEEVAKIANWDTKGGAPRTPGND
jgi:hypothetical protein